MQQGCMTIDQGESYEIRVPVTLILVDLIQTSYVQSELSSPSLAQSDTSAVGSNSQSVTGSVKAEKRKEDNKRNQNTMRQKFGVITEVLINICRQKGIEVDVKEVPRKTKENNVKLNRVTCVKHGEEVIYDRSVFGDSVRGTDNQRTRKREADRAFVFAVANYLKTIGVEVEGNCTERPYKEILHYQYGNSEVFDNPTITRLDGKEFGW